MKVLFAGTPGLGHLHPMVPLAAGLLARGDDVLFATAADAHDRLRRLGFDSRAAGMTLGEQQAEMRRRFPDRMVDPRQHLRDAFGTMFTTVRAPRMVSDLLRIVAEWEPDLLVHESAEFAAPLVATLTGVPWVHHSYGVLRPESIAELATIAMGPIWAAAEVAMPAYAGMYAHCYLDICPPRLQLSWPAVTAVSRLLRPELQAAPGDPAPRWPQVPGCEHRVLVTMGTVFAAGNQLLPGILRALADRPVSVLATLGSRAAGAPAPAAPNIRVEPFVALPAALATCDVVVTHGGAGTVLAALGHGRPLVLVPQGADQFLNTQRCEAVGAGVAVDGGSGDTVARQVDALLGDPAYADAARAVAGEIGSMPSAAEVLPALDALAASGCTR